jgi:uncharacterized lipoprotein YmbA
MRRFRLAAAIGMLLSLAACSLFDKESAPLGFFALTADAPLQASPAAVTSGIIGVQQVRLAPYLRQNAIVTREHPNELKLAANDNWAGALDANITAVLVENLARFLGENRVLAFPLSTAVPVVTEVQTDIDRFERTADGMVFLNARWLIFTDRGRQFVSLHRGTYSVAGVGTGYQAIAAAMSRLLVELSADMAASLSAAPGRSFGPAASQVDPLPAS